MAEFDHSDDVLDDVLRTSLRTMSDQARYADRPLPAAQIRSLGSRRRSRRVAGSAALAAVAVVGSVVVGVGGLLGNPLSARQTAPAATGISSGPTPSPAVDTTPDPANDVGYLVAVEPSSDGQLMVVFDRVITDDHVIVNNNNKLRVFPVETSALSGVTKQQLIDRTLASVTGLGHGPLVTLAHRGGADGVVIRLKELTLVP